MYVIFSDSTIQIFSDPFQNIRQYFEFHLKTGIIASWHLQRFHHDNVDNNTQFYNSVWNTSKEYDKTDIVNKSCRQAEREQSRFTDKNQCKDIKCQQKQSK